MSDQEEMNGAVFADNTAQKQQIGRPFEPGQSGNPNGRPKGSRNKINAKFLDALAKHFDEKGETAIETVFKDRPHEYLKIVAALLPKQMQIEDKRPERRAEDLSDDELAAIASRPLGGEGVNGSHPAGDGEQWS